VLAVWLSAPQPDAHARGPADAEYDAHGAADPANVYTRAPDAHHDADAGADHDAVDPAHPSPAAGHRQPARHASRIMQLPNRHYMLKVRGAGEPEVVYTPDYTGPFELLPATHRATMMQVAPLVNPDALDAELAWRWQWLEARQYDPPTDASDQKFSDNQPTPPTDNPSRTPDAADDPVLPWNEEEQRDDPPTHDE
jgi:hypothetical protein